MTGETIFVSVDNVYFLTDEGPDSPSSGAVSPKVTVLPPTLKRTVSEKDKEGQTSLQSGGSANKTTQDGGSLKSSSYKHITSCFFSPSARADSPPDRWRRSMFDVTVTVRL